MIVYSKGRFKIAIFYFFFVWGIERGGDSLKWRYSCRLQPYRDLENSGLSVCTKAAQHLGFEFRQRVLSCADS